VTMPAIPMVLHYVGYDADRGGIMSVVHALADARLFACVLGVNTGFVYRRAAVLPVLELPAFEGEVISLSNLWHARTVAREVQSWLRADPTRVFHGHSRAGLLVGLWLSRWKEQRVVVSVHCYGRQRWFYRWAARQLGTKLFWLSPAMRRYYGVSGKGGDWAQCMPECVSAKPELSARVVRDGVVRIAGVGFLTPWKGWHLVVEAMALLPVELKSRLKFCHIGPIGASPESARYAKELFANTKKAGLSESVQWLGEQPASAPLLAESDCLVVASNNEPFSLAMLESLFAGVPVVAADSGGATDLVETPKNGLLFKTGSSQDLARVFRLLVETDALAKVRIDREALRRFSAPVVAAQWAEVYARVSVVD
jgi:glycosyltransferase involved in cell wall biosynthesis